MSRGPGAILDLVRAPARWCPGMQRGGQAVSPDGVGQWSTSGVAMVCTPDPETTI